MTATRLFDRAVVRLSPQDESEDVAAFLQGLVTNDVNGTLPAYAALLTPQGKTLFDFLVWPAGENGLLLEPLDISDLYAVEVDFAEDLVRANQFV